MDFIPQICFELPKFNYSNELNNKRKFFKLPKPQSKESEYLPQTPISNPYIFAIASRCSRPLIFQIINNVR